MEDDAVAHAGSRDDRGGDAAAARDLVDLALADRVRLLSGTDFWRTEAIESAGIPSMLLTDGPHGVRRQPDDADHLGIGRSVPATCFPTASLLGATWDPDLLVDVGSALGRECRAHGVGVLLGPGLNIKRHPAGGRNFEYFSEDPLLSGRLAAAMTRGLQSEGVGACPKHFVANNHESYRMVADVIVDERTLRELYLCGFEIAVRDGRPWSVMTSYNLVNGTYVGDSEQLVDGVLRGEWGFDGMVVTDWGGTNDRVAAVRAGVDLEMPSSNGSHDAAIIDAVEAGDLDLELVDRRAATVARLAERTADERARRGAIDLDEVEHHRLARRVAAAGTVLLANDGVLPLDPHADIAVIGAFADHPRYQGAGSSQVVPTRLDDARRALEEHVSGHVRYCAGYDPASGESDTAQLREAAELARRADVAVVFVGLPAIDEAEGYDRTTLDLPPSHDDLVTAVCAANPRTVVVVCNGAPVFMPWAGRPAAIVEAYLGGQAGGAAVCDVLVGDAEPGGRLAETFPASMTFPSDEHFGDCRRQVQYREGLHVGYRFHTSAGVAPQFPFGHGLSYTDFEWSEPRVTGAGTDFIVHLTVTNTGDRPGSDVVQVYVRDVEASVYRPERELRGFAKVHLAPGESTSVAIELDRRAFAFWDVGRHDWFVEGGRYEVLIGASSADIRFTLDVDVVGDSGTPAPSAGPGGGRFVATDREFEEMLGHPIPSPTPVLPFTLNTVVDELGETRLGRTAQRAFLRLADRRTAKLLGDDPDPVVVKLSERMIREAPLRMLAAMSGNKSSLGAFDGLTKLLSTLRLTARRK